MHQNAYRQAQRLLVVGFVLFFFVGTGRATIEMLPGDTPVKIRGRIGDNTTFVKRFGLIATEAVPELILQPTDLLRSDGKERIGRQQIALTETSKLSLALNTPRDVEIKITGVKLPGTYTGTLNFLQPGQGLKAVVTIPLEVTAEGVPKLLQRKGSEAVKMQLFDCSSLGCYFAKWIQPGAFSLAYPLMFDNASVEEFEMMAAVNATGETTHGSLESVLKINSPMKVPVQPVYTLPIQIRQGHLLPDHYIGDVQLRLAADEPPMKIPLEVNVRTGPIWPMAVLLLGILLGRFVKYMKDKGTPQSDLLLQFYHLESRISSASPDLPLLQPMLEAVKALIYEMQLEVAKKEMTAIENRWTHLNTLRSLESSLMPRAGETCVAAILDDIKAARDHIKAKRDDLAKDLVAKIEVAVQNLPKPTPVYAAAHAMARAQARKAVADATRTVEGSARVSKKIIRWIGFFTGINGGGARRGNSVGAPPGHIPASNWRSHDIGDAAAIFEERHVWLGVVQ